MDVADLENYIILPRKYNKNEDVIRAWEKRLSLKIKETKIIRKRLEYEMAIMTVKYPFLETSQCRGKALAKMSIPSLMGHIPTTSTMNHLLSPTGKANALQVVSRILRNKKKATQHLKSRPKTNKQTSQIEIYTFSDLEEMNKSCSQSQKIQSLHSDSHTFKEIQNIPSKITKAVMHSKSVSAKVKQMNQKETPLDINKANNLDITKKRQRNTKRQKNMDSQGNEKIVVKNTAKVARISYTSICVGNICQDDRAVRDIKTKENEEGNDVSKINVRRKHKNQQQLVMNKESTLETGSPTLTAEENIIYSGNVFGNGDTTPPCTSYSNEPAVQNSNSRYSYSSSYCDYVQSSALSSPSYYSQQTNSESDVLPQHSPIYYLSADIYSGSNSDTENDKTDAVDDSYPVSPDILREGDKLSQSIHNPISMEDGDTVSQRSSQKTSASGSKNNITVTTRKNEESFLSEDYGTPTGNTVSSSDADFLADMFDTTTHAYRHHLRAVAYADLVADNCKTALDI